MDCFAGALPENKETAMKMNIIGAAALLLLVGGMSAFYDQSTYNCGFHSYQQCLDTIRGTGGYCRLNPWIRGRRG